jgi:hypothetical protein
MDNSRVSQTANGGLGLSSTSESITVSVPGQGETKIADFRVCSGRVPLDASSPAKLIESMGVTRQIASRPVSQQELDGITPEALGRLTVQMWKHFGGVCIELIDVSHSNLEALKSWFDPDTQSVVLVRMEDKLCILCMEPASKNSDATVIGDEGMGESDRREMTAWIKSSLGQGRRVRVEFFEPGRDVPEALRSSAGNRRLWMFMLKMLKMYMPRSRLADIQASLLADLEKEGIQPLALVANFVGGVGELTRDVAQFIFFYKKSMPFHQPGIYRHAHAPLSATFLNY